MARPKKVGEKAIVISVSCSPEEKELLDLKGISPTQLFREAIKKIAIENGSSNNDAEHDLNILRKYYVQSTKPNGNREIYLKGINLFLEKYPDWTKAEVMTRAERPRHVKLEIEAGAEQ